MSYTPANPRYCSGCRKALNACVCAWLKPSAALPTHFHVHPHEISRARSTSWLAHRLVLDSCYTVEGEGSEPDWTGYALLFPGEGVKPWSEAEFCGVVLVDGTWDECAAMIRHSPQLQALPRIGLQHCYTGGYLVRRAPWQGALCTAEALGRLYLEMNIAAGDALLNLVDKLNEREKRLANGGLR